MPSYIRSVAENSKNGASFSRPPIVVLVLALAIRIIYLYLYHNLPDWNFLTVDNYYHHHWAERLASGDIFGGTTYFRAPFYVYCLGLLYALFGYSFWVGRIFGLVIGLCSIFFTFRIAERVFNRKVANSAAFFQAIMPITIYFESELLLDPLFMLLLQVSVYYFLRWWDEKENRSLWTSGIALGLSAITRPTALVIIPILLIVVYFKQQEIDLKLSIARLLVPIVLIVGVIFARNMIVADDPVLIASQGGINFYIGNNENADGLSAVLPEPMGHNWQISQITRIAERETHDRLKPGEVSNYWRSKATDWILNNPGEFFRLYLKKVWYNFSNEEVSNNRSLSDFFDRIVILKYGFIPFGVLFTFMVSGVVFYWNKNRSVRLICALVGLYTLTSALFFFSSRFRLPLIPFYAVLAAGGLHTIELFVTHKKRVIASYIAGAIAFIVSFSSIVDYPQSMSGQSLVSRGLAYLNAGEFNSALGKFREAQNINPDFPELNLNLGVLFIKQGEIDSALAYFEKERALYPLRPKSYTNLATIALLDSNQVLAEGFARKAIELDPGDITARRVLLRAIALNNSMTLDNFAGAIDKAYGESADNVYLLNEAAVLVSQRGMIDFAEVLLQRAAVGSPPPIETDDLAFQANFPNSLTRWRIEQGHSYFQLSFLAGRQSRFNDAISYARRAIELAPGLPDAYVNLVTGLRITGRISEADSVLATALSRFPTDQNLQSLKL